MNQFPTLQDLQEALKRVQKYAHITPVLTSSRLDELLGASIYFKCENFQKVGAFKFRGAINAIFQSPEDLIINGIATHSSGNHGQAIALAAKMRGVPAYIVMPENSTKVKVEAVKAYGAEVILCDNSLEAREQKVKEVLENTGAHLIHPYDDYRIIAGQSTATQELITEVPDLDYIIAPIGGGGLISGAALAIKYLSPNIELIGGEPFGADDAWQSFQSKRHIAVLKPDTICDGLRASISFKTYEIIVENVKEIVRVTDDEVIVAMRLIWETMKIIIEPSCAVPFAASLKIKEELKGKRVGMILTGGNVDLGNLSYFK